MDDPVPGGVTSGKKSTRVRELEEKIKKLENENKKLLTKVRPSSAPLEHKHSSSKTSLHNGYQSKSFSLDDDELESGLLDINILLNEKNELKEDEWLFVSPKLPPTPDHKKITPHQWLSEGHYKDERSDEKLPSLDDVRKSLIFNMDEAENLNDIINYDPTSNSRGRLLATNKTAQKFQRQGQSAPKWKAGTLEFSKSASREDEVPLQKKWNVKQVPYQSLEEVESGRYGKSQDIPIGGHTSDDLATEDSEDVPIVKWKAKMPEDSQTSDVPVVKWKAKMPEDSGVPVVKWKAKMPEDSDVPVVKWKAKMPEDSDVPVVKWKAKMPEDSDVPVVKWKAKMPEDSDVPVVKWKAKMPEDSDVPVVKWKAKMPEDSGVPVVKWKAKMPEDSQTSDVPVVKWKAKMPEDSEVPVVKWKAKMPEDSGVPVVKWKAKMPEDSQTPVVRKAKMPEDSGVPVVKWKAKMPEDSQTPVVRKAKMPEDPEVPVVKWKAKMPEDSQTSDVPVVKWKAKMPEDSPKATKQSPSGQKKIQFNSLSADQPANERSRLSRYSSHHAKSQSPARSPVHSPVNSPSHSPSRPSQAQTETPKKPLSRRSSFSDSRSPSPPSISPQVRMAIASPVMSRRTPSPSRVLASLNARQSPSENTVVQHKQLQYIGSSQPNVTRSTPGSKLRPPRSQSSTTVKKNSPMRGITPPSDRRVLPSPPSTRSGGTSGHVKSSHSTPTKPVAHPSPSQDTGDDDDSWLEGCF